MIPTSAAVEEQLARLFGAPAFARSERLKAFLGFVVRRHLAGDDASLKEYTIGVEVFGKPVDFDPRIDSTVRVRATRLRSELEAYYAGRNDEILIALPRGHYIPEIVLRPSVNAPALGASRSRAMWKCGYVTILMTALVVMSLAVIFRGHVIAPRFLDSSAPGRLLALATSEGNHPNRIPLTHLPNSLAISPSGDRIFAMTGSGRVLSIIRTANRSVRTLDLPREGATLAVSPRGKLYIGSMVEGIMVLDISRERLVADLATGGPVRDIAVDPEGKRLFLAMGQLGLKQLSLDSGALTTVTDRTCPIHVALDHQGKRLYVAYQCSGPSGRAGHDSVEVFDADTGASLGIVTGPPIVGGPISISPDDKLALIDGQDACSSPHYDHSGCSSVPSRAFHLLRTGDRRILHTFNYPLTTEGEYCVDNSRFLLLGRSLSVVHAATYTVLETLDLSQTALSAVLARDGSRFWIGVADPPGLLEFERQRSACSAGDPNPAIVFTADGSLEDSSEGNVLSPHGQVLFTPGKVGQAFFLNGSSYLSMDSSGYYRIYRHDFSIALYVRFASTEGDVALADWSGKAPERGIRLSKSADNRVVFQAWPGQVSITSGSTVVPNTWYHVAVTKTRDLITLYVNGKAESSGKPPSHFGMYDDPLLLGAFQPGQPALHGWLDEIALYSRGLTAGEVSDLYQKGGAGPCRPN